MVKQGLACQSAIFQIDHAATDVCSPDIDDIWVSILRLKWTQRQMKSISTSLFLAALVVGTPAPAKVSAASDPVGLWRTISDVDGAPRALVRLRMVGGELRGEVAGTLRSGEDPNKVCAKCSGARKNQPISGMTILWGLRQDPRDPSQFIGGSVLDPETGDIFAARLRLSPDGGRLRLRGYLVVAMLGRSQTWMRAS